MLYNVIGMWALRRGFRLLTEEDPRPLAVRLGAEGKRILVGAAITLGLLILGAIVLIAVLIFLAT